MLEAAILVGHDDVARAGTIIAVAAFLERYNNLVEVITDHVLGVALVLLYEQTGPGQTISRMVLPVALYGAGVGLILAQITNMTMSAIPTAYSAEASGVLNVSYSIGFSLGTAVVGSYFLGHFYGGVVDGVLRAEGATVSAAQRTDLVITLEDAAETATDATQQQFLTQLTPAQRQLLEGIFEASMFDAQRATLLLLVLFVLLLLLASTFLPRQIPELTTEPTTPNHPLIHHVRRLNRPWKTNRTHHTGHPGCEPSSVRLALCGSSGRRVFPIDERRSLPAVAAPEPDILILGN